MITEKLTGKKTTYDSYKDKFDGFMTELGLDYVPGDTRTTFATKCSELRIPDPIIKRLMGHSLSYDVTNNVYIRKTVKDLLNEIEKIRY